MTGSVNYMRQAFQLGSGCLGAGAGREGTTQIVHVAGGLRPG